MLAILAYCPRDDQAAADLMDWINELGGCKNHDLLLIYDQRCFQTNQALCQKIAKSAESAFRTVMQLPAKAEINGWPEGANYMFRIGSGHTAAYLPKNKYFFWLEPDAIPLKEGWLDEIEGEYLKRGKLFMGDYVKVDQIPVHMSGVGVYPNPLHAHAGEAYRAFDLAWDMAAKDQIVPRAHFTELIEHAWKHPSFTEMSELDTQISKEAVLFHASKDGSLIKLLQQRKAGDVKCAPIAVATISTPSVLPDPSTSDAAPTVQSAGAANRLPFDVPPVTCDIFIRTYPADYQWLEYCLAAIYQFATGFRKIWVASPSTQGAMKVTNLPQNMEWKVLNDESEDGYLAQQITKLYADVITDYQADYILHIDSDVILTREITPQNFFAPNGKLYWLYTPYTSLQTPWQPIMEKFMIETQEFEFMRRFPMMFPRWLYPKLREFCYKIHHRIISEYIRHQPYRAFSEFNALGCYAWKYHQDKFEWVHTNKVDLPISFAQQFRSWEGITPEVKTEIEHILRGTGTGPTEAESSSVHPSASPVPSQIKELPNGIWVIEGDTHIGKWVEQQERLDHDQNILPFILPHIKEGDVVIDVGANIGDHTIAYARAVGATGRVIAFEPNALAFQCLKHNLENFIQVVVSNTGLSDKNENVALSDNNGNYGGSYVDKSGNGSTLEVLDDIPTRPNLIKIDAEGYEPKVLAGAEKTVTEFRPKMVIEVNIETLSKQGFRRDDIFAFLNRHKYTYKVIQENCGFDSPMYDIYCEPQAVMTVPPGGAPETTRPHAHSSLEASLSYQGHVHALATFAGESPANRTRVIKELGKAGLHPLHPKKKGKKK